MQRVLDEALEPFGTLLLEGAGGHADEHDLAPRDAPSRVLDIGCGAGATTFLAAKRVGQTGSCVGVDASSRRAGPVRIRRRRSGAPDSGHERLENPRYPSR